MAINLLDIPAAVEAYLLNSVTVTVAPIVPAGPRTMNPDEYGSTSVTVTNADPGIRLTDVKHHLTIEPSTRAKLEVPGNVLARVAASTSSQVLVAGDLVSEMFLFPLDNVLEAGDSDTLAFRVKALDLGSVTVSDHVHARIESIDVLPISNSRPGEIRFSIV